MNVASRLNGTVVLEERDIVYIEHRATPTPGLADAILKIWWPSLIMSWQWVLMYCTCHVHNLILRQYRTPNDETDRINLQRMACDALATVPTSVVLCKIWCVWLSSRVSTGCLRSRSLVLISLFSKLCSAHNWTPTMEYSALHNNIVYNTVESQDFRKGSTYEHVYHRSVLNREALIGRSSKLA